MSWWHSWQIPRLSAITPLLLLLLTTSGVAFVLGCFTSSFLSSNATSPVGGTRTSSLRILPVDFITFRENCAAGISPGRVRSFILDKIFDGVGPFEKFPSPEVAPLLRQKRIKGWGSDAPVFTRLMKQVRPKVILELGTFLGASAINMGNIARNLSLKPVILCVDDFRAWPGFRTKKFKDIKLVNGDSMLYYQFLKNVQFMNLTDIILPVPFSNTGAVMNFCEWGIRPDLIGVDGALDFHSTWLDLNYAYSILSPGGVMFGHDYFNRANEGGVRRAVDLFAKIKNLRVEPDGKHWILRNR